MKKFYLLLILFCAIFDIHAQQNNSRLNIKSLRLIENDTEASRAMKKDINGDKCALIKIQTPNMNEAERNKLKFSADMGTFVYVDETAVGEVKLFLTEGCKTMIIMHPDYGKLTYPMPLTLEGWRTYEMVLMADKDDPLTPKTVTLNTNYVTINVTPKDALINVDGKLCKNGKVNLTVDEPHHLEVSHRFYHTYECEIHASATEKLKYDVNLAPAHGWLKIDSKPESGAIVLINGERKGTTPFTSDTLSSGEYEVKLMKDLYETGIFTVVVTDSKTQEVELPIKPTFALVTATTDSESEIYIDGEKKGKGKWHGRLLEGTHILEARKISHRTTAVKLDVIVGKNESVVINNPVPIYGALDIQSEPDEVEVYLDGVKIGETPLKKNDVLVGNRTIRFEKKGCATLTKSYMVEENNILSVYEKLDSGKIISITTGRNGDKIYVDGTYAGVSPLEVSMGYGQHTVKAERYGKSVEKSLEVRESGGESNLYIEFLYIEFLVNQTITVNGVSFEMVYVEGGTFEMGATSEQGSEAYGGEKPVPRVTLSDYIIGKYEVTQELWEAVMGSNPSNYSGKNNPVENVSWNDCQKFIIKLNSLTGMTFRLPTEAEYAARGGNKSRHYKYSGSNNIDDVAWYTNNSGSKTHAVGTKVPNELGIYDMSGNVWEWCSDWCLYATNSSGSHTSVSYRILRGGSWNNGARNCRVSDRNYFVPRYSNGSSGLRLALDP